MASVTGDLADKGYSLYPNATKAGQSTGIRARASFKYQTTFAGAAALILSKQPDLTAKEVVHIIKSSSKKIPQLRGKCQTEGILDISKALSYL